MDGATACERCLTAPKPIRVATKTFPAAVPASVAWLRSQDPKEFFEVLQSARAALNDKDVAQFRSFEGRISAAAGIDNARTLLSTVILSLAARGRIRLLDISHRAGFASRLFGKTESAAIHVATSRADRDADGAIETTLLASVKSQTGPKTPHGPTLREVIESLLPSPVTHPAREILDAAKQDAVERGIGRWIPESEIPRLEESGGGLVEALFQKMLERSIRGVRFYEILRSRESSIATEFAALDAMRRDVASGDLSRIEEEIEEGIAARTYVPSSD